MYLVQQEFLKLDFNDTPKQALMSNVHSTKMNIMEMNLLTTDQLLIYY